MINANRLSPCESLRLLTLYLFNQFLIETKNPSPAGQLICDEEASYSTQIYYKGL